jgi:saccharopine dehydrogenase-like NADP-dependent oxidoreductase
MKRIIVLGGYGGTGRILCRRLLEETDVEVAIAGRDVAKAEKLSGRLNERFPGRVSATFADATNRDSLSRAFAGATLVVDATTAVESVANVATAALEADADYLDYHFDQTVPTRLKALESEIQAAGRCFITQAGFHPGLPAAFVRYVAPQFDQLERATVGIAMSVDIEKPESIYELVDLLADYSADVLDHGKWRRATWRDTVKVHFTRFGRKTCSPIQLVEMRDLPKMYPSLEATGVYAAGFNWFTDWLVFPLAIVLSAIRKGLGRQLIARLLTYGLSRFSRKTRGVSLVLEAEGLKSGQPVTYRVEADHDDAYEFTAIPIAGCLKQYLDGSITNPGLWLMGQVVDPARLVVDMASMGVNIQEAGPQ